MTNFSFLPLIFRMEAKEDLKFPSFKTAVLRGALGYTLKELSCVGVDRSCTDCILRSKCVYAKAFEPHPLMPPSPRRYSFIPKPFTLFVPYDTKRNYHQGEAFTFNLILMGNIIEDLPYFVYAFALAGEKGLSRGRFKLVDVKLGEPAGREALVYSSNTNTLYTGYSPITWEECVKRADIPNTNRVTLLFQSPLRLKEKGDLVVNLSFPTFISRVKERIELISYFHCGGASPPMEDPGFTAMAREITVEKRSLRWQETERYSTRQKAKMKLGGLIGMITFKGNLNPFIPYLILGQYIHVGQGTTSGLGKYEILKWG